MSEVVIRCRKSGPLVVTGTVTVIDHLGNVFPLDSGKENIALCRCGRSSKKPFCDGSHRECGFIAEELAPTPQDSPLIGPN